MQRSSYRLTVPAIIALPNPNAQIELVVFNFLTLCINFDLVDLGRVKEIPF